MKLHCVTRTGLLVALLLATTTGVTSVRAGDAGPVQGTAQPPAGERWLRETVLGAGYPGARLIVASADAVLVDATAGYADVAATTPLREDAIYRIHSMTKPIVSAAVLRLLDAGHAHLDDPVAAHLPALSGLMVLEDGRRRPPARPLTIRHLLSHTSGLPVLEPGPLRLREARAPEHSASLADLVARLRGIALERDPGTRFVYDGLATDILGRLVEVWSGQTLDAHLQATFFAPLGMRDTGFAVPEDQRHRLVELSRVDAQGRLVATREPEGHIPGTALRPYPSAAGGLYSTARDYLAFARMLLARGRHGDAVILSPAMVDAMARDQLGPMQLAHPFVDERPGRGFGLGLSVLLDPAALGRDGAPGQAGWTGSASTYFVIDPAGGRVGLLLLQHLPGDHAADLPRVAQPFYNFVQQVPVP